MEYGYIRVSSSDQNEDRQRIALIEAGVPEGNIFLDKQSGKNFDRPQYKRMVRKLREGDVLFVKSLDRFGRNYDEIQEQWRFITVKKKAAIVVMDMPLLDTRRDRDLIGRVIGDIVLQLLSYVAQIERELIRQRQAEGIAAAKARGVRFGRAKKEKPSQFEKAYCEWRAGNCGARDAGEYCGVSHKTFLKWANERHQREACEL